MLRQRRNPPPKANEGVEITLLARDLSKLTIKPLPLLALGAVLVTSSIAAFPWLELLVLAQGSGGNDASSIYQSHVRVGLWQQCSTLDRHDVKQTCYSNDSSQMVAFRVFLILDALLALSSLAVACLQHFRERRDAEDKGSQKNVPGVLVLEFLAGSLSFLSGLLAAVILLAVKGQLAGSASLCFFLCATGAVCLLWGGWVAFQVAYVPADKPAWSVMVSQPQKAASSEKKSSSSRRASASRRASSEKAASRKSSSSDKSSGSQKENDESNI